MEQQKIIDVTDQFPSEENTRPEGWLFRAVCHCARDDTLQRIVDSKDETGKWVATLFLNGVEIGVTEFFKFAESQFEDCVKREAKKLFRDELDDLTGIFYDGFDKLRDGVEKKLGIDIQEEDY